MYLQLVFNELILYNGDMKVHWHFLCNVIQIFAHVCGAMYKEISRVDFMSQSNFKSFTL